MDEQVKVALDAFVDVADEVLFEGNVESHGARMIDAYVALRTAMSRHAQSRLKEYLAEHPEFLDIPTGER